MPLETATYITDLVVTNPANSDGLNQADDHMRLIKAAVKATFPNFTSAALSSTQAQIDTAIAAVVTRSAFVPAGAVQDFAMAAAPTGWLECNGAAVSRTTYATLYAAIGTTWGAGDGTTTFNLPPDRYRVGRTAAAAAVGTLQASQNKAHTHTVTGAPAVGSLATASGGSHFHTASIADPGHTHSVSGGIYGGTALHAISFNDVSGLYAPAAIVIDTAFTGITITSANGTNTTNTAAAHTHTITGAPAVGSLATASDGGTDGRPLSAVYLTCIKT